MINRMIGVSGFLYVALVKGHGALLDVLDCTAISVRPQVNNYAVYLHVARDYYHLIIMALKFFSVLPFLRLSKQIKL